MQPPGGGARILPNLNGFPAGSRDPSSQVSTGQKAVERGAQEVVSG